MLAPAPKEVEVAKAFGTKRGCTRLRVQRRPTQTNSRRLNRRMVWQHNVRNEGMRPVCWSSQPADDGTMPLAELGAQSAEIPAEPVPAETPGVFLEQPLERWSPRDLIMGVSRLVRWTRLATS